MAVTPATKNDENYSQYYKKDIPNVYPTEWVIRSFLGTYPRWKMDRSDLVGKRVLDLAFGDGRNMLLLADMRVEVHGVEVTPDICENITARMAKRGLKIEARVGRNSSIPYEDAFFDHLLSSSACYYIDEGETFSDNLKEIARVIKPGGIFVHCLPMPTTFILEGAKDIGDGHMRITKDPYGVRVDAILKKFDNEEQIEKTLSPFFTDIRIGRSQSDYWGSQVDLWLVTCRRK